MPGEDRNVAGRIAITAAMQVSSRDLLVVSPVTEARPGRTVASKSQIKRAVSEMPRAPAQWTGPEHSHPMLPNALPRSERRLGGAEPVELPDPGFSSRTGIASAANRGDQRIDVGRDAVDASLVAVRPSPDKGRCAFQPNRLCDRHIRAQTL